MEKLCKNIAILEKGKLYYCGKISDLLESFPQIITFHYPFNDTNLTDLFEKYNIQDYENNNGKYLLRIQRNISQDFVMALYNEKKVSELAISNISLKEAFLTIIGG